MEEDGVEPLQQQPPKKHKQAQLFPDFQAHVSTHRVTHKMRADFSANKISIRNIALTF